MMGHNSLDWISNSLNSALQQEHKNFDVIAIDAMTNDGTYEYLIEEETKHDNLTVVRNEKRKYQTQNIYEGCRMVKEGSIIVTLDFDDWFPHENVLKILDSHYNDNVWMTYGSYQKTGDGSTTSFGRYPDDIVQENKFREVDWRATHLRTFRKELSLKIKEEDFKDNDGNWITVAGDLVFMWPMLEMSGEKFIHIEEPLYVYNEGNEMSEYRTSVPLILESEKMVRNRKPYERLKSL
tara:strand:+ start:2309 stop:3019 length:711 start_codon:yes stop_codon:yes gene_type:complete